VKNKVVWEDVPKHSKPIIRNAVINHMHDIELFSFLQTCIDLQYHWVIHEDVKEEVFQSMVRFTKEQTFTGEQIALIFQGLKEMEHTGRRWGGLPEEVQSLLYKAIKAASTTLTAKDLRHIILG
jgi:TRAP-type mannitol/chloroaromatic compound transport system substrate-binding protein